MWIDDTLTNDKSLSDFFSMFKIGPNYQYFKLRSLRMAASERQSSDPYLVWIKKKLADTEMISVGSVSWLLSSWSQISAWNHYFLETLCWLDIEETNPQNWMIQGSLTNANINVSCLCATQGWQNIFEPLECTQEAADKLSRHSISDFMVLCRHCCWTPVSRFWSSACGVLCTFRLGLLKHVFLENFMTYAGDIIQTALPWPSGPQIDYMYHPTIKRSLEETSLDSLAAESCRQTNSGGFLRLKRCPNNILFWRGAMRCLDSDQVADIFTSENVTNSQKTTLELAFSCSAPWLPESAASNTIQLDDPSRGPCAVCQCALFKKYLATEWAEPAGSAAAAAELQQQCLVNRLWEHSDSHVLKTGDFCLEVQNLLLGGPHLGQGLRHHQFDATPETLYFAASSRDLILRLINGCLQLSWAQNTPKSAYGCYSLSGCVGFPPCSSPAATSGTSQRLLRPKGSFGLCCFQFEFWSCELWL